MSSLITLTIASALAEAQNIYVFQVPADYAGGQPAYVNSLGTLALAPPVAPDTEGVPSPFPIDLSEMAGLQSGSGQNPVVGKPSGKGKLITQAMNLSSVPPLNNTRMTQSPLALSAATYNSNIQPNLFCITTEVYSSINIYNAGSAITANETKVLSNFVVAEPNQDIFCQPIDKFYVAVGNVAAGTVIDFNTVAPTAALCDFTKGYTQAVVTLLAGNTWSVSMLA